MTSRAGLRGCKEKKAMNKEKSIETVFDETDEAIAAAFGDASAWPRPSAGFRERCAARVAEIVAERKARRARWVFARAQWMKIAAVLLVVAGFAAVMLRPQGDALVATDGVGRQGALVAQFGPALDADGLYEEVEETCEVAPMPDARALLAEAAKKTLPDNPATKMLGALCLAALKTAGI